MRSSFTALVLLALSLLITACGAGRIDHPDSGADGSNPVCTTAAECDDSNPCTDDSCDPEVGCGHADNTAACDDGLSCTSDDVCSGGACSGVAVGCDDGNPCTSDGCQDGVGCVYTNNTLGCDDGNACTTADACSGGACAGGPATDCDDGNGCTDDSCDPASGCSHANNALGCDDGNACTTADACSGGACGGGAAPNCDDGNGCTDDGCDPALGCTHANNALGCDDGSACTTGDTCAGGACGGTALACDDGNGCTDDGCDPISGCTHADNTLACDDGNACTTADTCSGGACGGGAAPNCDDGNGCTDDGCDPASGCTHTDNALGCDDGNACTTADTCSGGTCIGGAAPNCDDGNTCTTDGCDPASGCTHANNTLGCDDGDACTTTDACAGGACGGAAVDCDDGSGCTTDACNPASGCTHTDACDPHATCQNLSCVCQAPYVGTGFQCSLPCGDGDCGAGETLANCPQDCDFDLVVVVNNSIYSALAAQLEQYRADTLAEGKRVYAMAFTGSTAADLRAALVTQVAERGVEGAWLVGDLPAAWYEQTAFSTWEEFPCDIYLLDLDSSWTDSNSNGRFDSHGSIDASFFVSRLMGTQGQIQTYFGKLHAYRTTGSLIAPSVFIFKDDDWEYYYTGSSWGLDAIYTTFTKIEALDQTTLANYLAVMDGAGAEFVYQWIHSYPSALVISGTGGGSVSTTDITNGDHQGSFFNLFDCSAARFSETNLGMTYAVRTSAGLAVIGSTKTGGIYDPWTFHNALAAGDTWGEAFRLWYNSTGRYIDEWWLGIVILGDPLLTLSGDTKGLIELVTPPAPSAAELGALRETMRRWAERSPPLGTFEQYRAAHPQFFAH